MMHAAALQHSWTLLLAAQRLGLFTAVLSQPEQQRVRTGVEHGSEEVRPERRRSMGVISRLGVTCAAPPRTCCQPHHRQAHLVSQDCQRTQLDSLQLHQDLVK